jgi:hypothetical protein
MKKKHKPKNSAPKLTAEINAHIESLANLTTEAAQGL